MQCARPARLANGYANLRRRLAAIENRCASQRRPPFDGSAFFCVERNDAFDLRNARWLRWQVTPIAIGSSGVWRCILRRLRRRGIRIVSSRPLRFALMCVITCTRLAIVTPMCQHRLSDPLDMFRRNRRRLLQRSQCPRCTQHHEIGTQPIDRRVDAQRADMRMYGVVEVELRQCFTRRTNPLNICFLLLRIAGTKTLRIEIERQTRFDNLLTHLRLKTVLQLDHQTKSIDQLRPQLAFFRIHRTDQHEARIVTMRDTIAFDGIHTTGSGIE